MGGGEGGEGGGGGFTSRQLLFSSSAVVGLSHPSCVDTTVSVSGNGCTLNYNSLWFDSKKLRL